MSKANDRLLYSINDIAVEPDKFARGDRKLRVEFLNLTRNKVKIIRIIKDYTIPSDPNVVSDIITIEYTIE